MAKVMHNRKLIDLTKDTFWSVAIPIPFAGCWIWPGTSGMGYGKIRDNDVEIGAHRWAYEAFVGPIPDGHLVCHSCDVVGCVNPAHLFVGTNGDNMSDMKAKRRGNYARRSACKYGHEFTPENTYMCDGARRCRTCARIRQGDCRQRRLAHRTRGVSA